MDLIKRIKKIWSFYDQSSREQLSEAAAYELTELEHIFALLVLGSFVGLPSPPLQISLELLPYMESDLKLLLEKTDTAISPLSDLASIFEVG